MKAPIGKRQLKKLDFYFIDSISPYCNGYKIIYAKSIQEENTSVIVHNDRVSFWDNNGYDHCRVVYFADILFYRTV